MIVDARKRSELTFLSLKQNWLWPHFLASSLVRCSSHADALTLLAELPQSSQTYPFQTFTFRKLRVQ